MPTYGDKYRAFVACRGAAGSSVQREIVLQKKDYTGALHTYTSAEEPLNYIGGKGGNDEYKPVVGSWMEARFLVPLGDEHLEEIENAPPGDFRMQVRRVASDGTRTVEREGHVITDTYEEELKVPYRETTVRAMDGDIGLLKDVRYREGLKYAEDNDDDDRSRRTSESWEQPSGPTGYKRQTPVTIITNALSKLPGASDVVFAFDWFPHGASWSTDATANPLANTLISNQSFYDDGFVPLTCREVLRRVLTAFNLQLRWKGDHYEVSQYELKRKSTYRTWRYASDGSFISTQTVSPRRTIGSEGATGVEVYARSVANRSYRQAFAQVPVVYDFDPSPPLIRNASFDRRLSPIYRGGGNRASDLPWQITGGVDRRSSGRRSRRRAPTAGGRRRRGDRTAGGTGATKETPNTVLFIYGPEPDKNPGEVTQAGGEIESGQRVRFDLRCRIPEYPDEALKEVGNARADFPISVWFESQESTQTWYLRPDGSLASTEDRLAYFRNDAGEPALGIGVWTKLEILSDELPEDATVHVGMYMPEFATGYEGEGVEVDHAKVYVANEEGETVDSERVIAADDGLTITDEADELTTYVGNGPTQSTPNHITLTSGGDAENWKRGPYSSGEAAVDYSLTQRCAEGRLQGLSSRREQYSGHRLEPAESEAGLGEEIHVGDVLVRDGAPYVVTHVNWSVKHQRGTVEYVRVKHGLYDLSFVHTQTSSGGTVVDDGSTVDRLMSFRDEVVEHRRGQSTTTTRSAVSGTGLTQVPIQQIEHKGEPTALFESGDKLSLVNAFTGAATPLEVTQRRDPSDLNLHVQSFDASRPIPEGSMVFPRGGELASIATQTRYAHRQTVEADAVVIASQSASAGDTQIQTSGTLAKLEDGQILQYRPTLTHQPQEVVVDLDTSRSDVDETMLDSSGRLKEGETMVPVQSLPAFVPAGTTFGIAGKDLQSTILQQADEISLRVKRGDVVSQLNVEFDNINVDTYVFRSANWDGVIEDPDGDGIYEITDAGTIGWALANSGDVAVADAIIRNSLIIDSTIEVSDSLFKGDLEFDDTQAGAPHAMRWRSGGALRGSTDASGAEMVEVLTKDESNLATLHVSRLITEQSVDQKNVNEYHVADQFVTFNQGQTSSSTLNGGIYGERPDGDVYWMWEEGRDTYGYRQDDPDDAGVLSSDVSGSVSSLPVSEGTRMDLPDNTELTVIDVADGSKHTVYVANGGSTLSAGATSIPVDDGAGSAVSVSAASGSEIEVANTAGTFYPVALREAGLQQDLYASLAADSELLDGHEANAFPRKAENATITAHWTFQYGTNTTVRIRSNNYHWRFVAAENWGGGSFNNHFIIDDETNAQQPFAIELGSPTDSLNITTTGVALGRRSARETLDVGGTGRFDDTLTVHSLTHNGGAGTHLQSDHFQARKQGYQITHSGDIDARSAFFDEMRVRDFIAELYYARAGGTILTKSRGTLASRFTTPAPGGTGTLHVEDQQGHPNARVFEVGDTILLYVSDNSGDGFLYEEVWLQADSYTDQDDGTQKWQVTRLSDGGTADLSVYAGAVAVDWGTPGDAIIETTAIGSNAPYQRQARWYDDAGDGIPDRMEIVSHTGELGAVSAANTTGGGIYTEQFRGQDILLGTLDRAGPHFEADGTHVALGSASHTHAEVLGDVLTLYAPSGETVTYSGSGIEHMASDGTTLFSVANGSASLTGDVHHLGGMYDLNADGSGQVAQNAITWTSGGDLTIQSGTVQEDVDIYGALRTQTGVPSDNSLIAYYAFEGADRSNGAITTDGTGQYPGTLVGSGFQAGQGVAGRRMGFQTGDHGSHITCEAVPLGQRFSASLWAGSWGTSTEVRVLAATYHAFTDNPHGWQCRIENRDTLTTVYGDGTNSVHKSSSLPEAASAGLPHIVVYVDADQGVIEHWVDGELRDRWTGLTTLTIDHGDLYLGQAENYVGSNDARAHEGPIDEVRFYSRQLTRSEVLGLYHNPSGSQGSTMHGDQLLTGTVTADKIVADVTLTEQLLANDATVSSTLSLGSPASMRLGEGDFDSDGTTERGIWIDPSNYWLDDKTFNFADGILAYDGTAPLQIGANATFAGTITGPNAQLGNAGITGVLTMGAGSEIANAGGTYDVTEQGFAVYGISTSTEQKRAFNLFNAATSNLVGQLGLFEHSNGNKIVRLEGGMDAADPVRMRIETSGGMVLESGYRIRLNSSHRVNMITETRSSHPADGASGWTEGDLYVIESSGRVYMYPYGSGGQPSGSTATAEFTWSENFNNSTPSTTQIAFDASDSVGATQHVWDFGDGSSPVEAGETPTHDYPAGQTFDVTLDIGGDTVTQTVFT